MELVRVKDTSSPNFDAVWEIYIDSFPANERRVATEQEKTFDDPNYRFYSVIHDNKVIGLIAYWQLEFLFIEHLAVHKKFRNSGIGSKIISKFTNEHKSVMLEAEPPDSVLAKRRIDFYERSGFCVNELDYVQPSYGSQQAPVPLLLLSYPKMIHPDDVERTVGLIHSFVYGIK